MENQLLSLCSMDICAHAFASIFKSLLYIKDDNTRLNFFDIKSNISGKFLKAKWWIFCEMLLLMINFYKI